MQRQRRIVSNDLKWMVGSDFHIPYQNDKYVKLWFQVMKWFKPDVVDYLGDIDDQSCFSRFSDGTPDELLNRVSTYSEDVRALYAKTREMRPDSELFVALGNHDIRVFDYIDKKAPAFKDMVTPESMWGLDSLGYSYIHYGDLPKHRYGDIYVHHGVSISKHSAESVRNDVNEFGVSIMRGHSHRLGSYFKTHELRGETWRGYEIGHMTDVKSEGMAYTNSHNWQPGFAVGLISGDTVHIQLVEIQPDNTCWVSGRKFAA
jgi:predicted phosphodiesterase